MKAAVLRDFRPLFVKKTLPGQNYEQAKTVLRRYILFVKFACLGSIVVNHDDTL